MGTLRGTILNVVWFLVVVGSVQGEDTRRLLLHSTDDLLQTIETLTTKVQTLEATVAKMSQWEATIAQIPNQQVDSAKVLQLEATVATLQNTVQNAGGRSTYVRWGRLTCPTNGTTTLYSGYTAGSGYLQKGGGSNTLCLPPDPQWDHYDDAVGGGSQIEGTEYDIGWDDANREPSFFGKHMMMSHAQYATRTDLTLS